MPRYQRQDKIDSGGFGCVYRAKRVEDGELVAFKVLEAYDLTEEDRKRFVREVRIQSQLDHPHIVPIVGSNLKVDPPFFVMPLAVGNLRTRLQVAPFVMT
ncbi:MAG: protein kinase [Candidatus Binatia bacterium]